MINSADNILIRIENLDRRQVYNEPTRKYRIDVKLTSMWVRNENLVLY